MHHPFVSSRRAKRESAVHKHANTAANLRRAVIYLDFTANKVCTQSCRAKQSIVFQHTAAAQSIPHQTERATIESGLLCARWLCVRVFLYRFLFLRRESRGSDGILGAAKPNPPYIARARSANSERAATIYCAVQHLARFYLYRMCSGCVIKMTRSRTNAHRRRLSQSAKSFLRPGKF